MNSKIFETATHITKHNNGFISFTHEITWLSMFPTGWGNGYVGVPEGNKLYGEDYDNVNCDVNGGLTFSEELEYEGIKYFVFGFDCAHSWSNPIQHDEDFVINETKRLFEQICNLSK